MPEFYLGCECYKYLNGVSFNIIYNNINKPKLFCIENHPNKYLILTLNELYTIKFNSSYKFLLVEIPDLSIIYIYTHYVISEQITIIDKFDSINDLFEKIYNSTDSVNEEEDFYEYFRNKEKNVKRALQYGLHPEKHIFNMLNVSGLSLRYYRKYCALNENLIKVALNNNSYTFKYLMPLEQTEENVKIALYKNPYCFMYVRDDLKTKEICDLAISINKYNFKYITDGKIDNDDYLSKIIDINDTLQSLTLV
jgi:hypothetical protein